MLKTYFQDIFNTTKTGDATEESYYSDLKRLIENWGKEKGKKFYVTPLPKRTEAGNPDFRIWDGKEKIVGYIEAKAPTVEDLEIIEDSDQLKRYRHTFPNLLLTNFFEFRLYRNGELIDKVIIGRPFVIHKLKMVPPVENQEKFLGLLEQYFSFSTPKTTTAKALALELAKRTRFLRDNVIAEELKEETIPGTQTLEGFYKAFKDHLISFLSPKDFANLFAQTITYGLFAARSRAENSFNRELAYKYIPHTIGILRDVFRFISSTDLPKSMEWIVDDIAEILAAADVRKIMQDFYKEGRGRDPIVHFYETFLAEYDPAEREKRGVYYTPEPVVSYIVRSTHQLLKEKFSKEDGFATQSVTVLDPASGTLTFPAEAIRLAIKEYKKKYGDGGIRELIKDHILKNFYAFELMMAPYAVGHLKIGFVLDEFGYKLLEDERFNLYLTNTLDFTKEDPNRLPGIFEQTIAKESGEALEVKESIPIMVIMGNPPYSGVSENKGEWILKQIEEYKKIEGESLGERNPKWIQDDYVKFFRFAQWKIEKTGAGILGFITNHAWLDNPTFRGMRYSLLKTFDEIYILNLHGSALKKEKTPEGGKDENVFDIQAGVSISIFVKKPKSNEKKVFYSDLWGLRGDIDQPGTKYYFLHKNDIRSTIRQTITPNKPYYFFVPKEEKGFEQYQNFLKVTDVFPVNSVGVVTARDEFVIDFDRQPLETKIRIFRDSNEDDEFVKQAYDLEDKPTVRWYAAEARRKLRELKNWEEYFTKILYRPFDERWIYYHSSVVERTRENVMKHMLKPNLALIVNRTVKAENLDHFFVTEGVNDLHIFETANASAYTFPLYLYNNSEKQSTLFDSGNVGVKSPNINRQILNSLGKKPEEIFYYIYAVLYSNTYRQKYQEFLKIDFPRIPFTKDYKLFQELAELGKKLVDLHLLKSLELNNPLSKFYGSNGNRVEKREYDARQKRVYINSSQYFEGIDPEVWNYYIGGYQVLDKWLKDRKDHTLSSEDIKHYCKVVTVLSKTIELQKKIDELYPEVEKDF
ncbi:MAG TPA: type ISP restriction/modification enzyme [Candidatus Nanoarchaeia archaeon]